MARQGPGTPPEAPRQSRSPRGWLAGIIPRWVYLSTLPKACPPQEARIAGYHSRQYPCVTAYDSGAVRVLMLPRVPSYICSGSPTTASACTPCRSRCPPSDRPTPSPWHPHQTPRRILHEVGLVLVGMQCHCDVLSKTICGPSTSGSRPYRTSRTAYPSWYFMLCGALFPLDVPP